MDNPRIEQTPSKVLTDYIDCLDGTQKRSVIDDLYVRLLFADTAVLKQVLTGKRKSAVKLLIDRDSAELSPDDYERGPIAPGVKAVVDHIVELINVIDVANKKSGALGLDEATIALTEYVAAHPNEVGSVTIDGMPFGKYLHSIAGSDECNNVLASTVRPRLVMISAGRPMVLLVEQRLKEAGVLR